MILKRKLKQTGRKLSKMFTNTLQIREFAKVNKSIMAKLLADGRNRCELRLLESCNDTGLVLDHIIPLSSNELNKRIRKLPTPRGKKIARQSVGSNHPSNLLVACPKCNGYKKHRFIKRVGDKWLIVKGDDPIWHFNMSNPPKIR